MLEIRIVKTVGGCFSSIFAGEDISKGSEIFDLTLGEFHETRNLRTVELNIGHVDHPVGRYVNHSCDPTAFVDRENNSIVSARDIKKGEQVTFDYTKNESAISAPFDCACGATNCMGRVSR
jgi:hypothetical protein